MVEDQCFGSLVGEESELSRVGCLVAWQRRHATFFLLVTCVELGNDDLGCALCVGLLNSRSLNSLQSSLRTHRVDQSQDTTAICMVFFRCLPKLQCFMRFRKKKASIFTWCFLRRLPNKLNLAHIWMYIITAWACYIAFFFFDRNMECWPLY
jgi:alanine-alpha-ketoisovalerate/valine-pyruvate aminotransferase